MARININFSTINKRSICLESGNVREPVDVNRRISNLKTQLESTRKNSYIPRESIDSFLESLNNSENANNHYRNLLYFVQEFNKFDTTIGDRLVKEFANNIIPYINAENLSYIEESASRYEMFDEQRAMIKEAVEKNIIADRILANHSKISKRFNLESEIHKVKSRGLKFVLENCCSMIDTYTIAPYAKFNLCIEEAGYLLDKNNISYDKKDFVKYISEYFLLRSNNISDKDYKGYKMVLTENCYIVGNDTESVDYVLNKPEYDRSEPSIQKEINYFLALQNKTLDNLKELYINCLSSSPVDITKNFIKVLWLSFNIYKSNTFNPNETMEVISDVLFKELIRRLQDTDFCQEDIYQIKNTINDMTNVLVYGSSDNDDYIKSVTEFNNMLSDLSDRVDMLCFISYSDANLNAINFVNKESAETVPLNEFKIFKFHNLVRAATNLDKFLAYKARTVGSLASNKGRRIIKKIKDVLFPESVEYMYSTIGEDHKSDICVAQYEVDDENVAEMKNFLEESCKEFNDTLASDSIRSYYIINPGVAEVHVKESAYIEIEEDKWNEVFLAETSELDYYIEQGAFAMSILESFGNILENNKYENLNSSIKEFVSKQSTTKDHVETLVEAMSILNMDKDIVESVCNSYIDSKYSLLIESNTITESEFNTESRSIKKLAEVYEAVDFAPIDYQLEAFQIIDAILESDDLDNKPIDKNKKNPFAGINLNSMKLALLGLKKNMSTMSQKEKEFSRNADNNFRLFVKAMKNALVSDRREAIIKGSVIPSFSRCVKILIGFGLFVAVGPKAFLAKRLFAALVAAIAGFAMSKRLTHKERLLLLDEIETELQVVEKEINMAESKNQMKKYRTLLTYKKNLQRQYQRIKYNIRVGKDILPGAGTGVPNSND